MIHADETPAQMLKPGAKKTHRSDVWAYATSQFSDLAAVVYDFSPSRAGEHARNFLKGWKGKLVCDDFGGYKASFELGVTEIYLKDVLTRLPTQRASEISELRPHKWQPVWLRKSGCPDVYCCPFRDLETNISNS